MAIVSRIGEFLSDDRLLFNLIAIHVLLVSSLIVSIVLRRLLAHGGNHLVQLTGLSWLHGMSQEASRKLKTFFFWTTLGAMALTVLGGLFYHAQGRDVRGDFSHWYEQLTWKDLWIFGRASAELALLGVGIWLGTKQLRRWLPVLHGHVAKHLEGNGHADTLKRWFGLFERYAIALLSLGAFWCPCRRRRRFPHSRGHHPVRRQVIDAVVPDIVACAIRLGGKAARPGQVPQLLGARDPAIPIWRALL